MNSGNQIHVHENDHLWTDTHSGIYPGGYLTLHINGDGNNSTIFVTDPDQALRFAEKIVEAARELQGSREQVPA